MAALLDFEIVSRAAGEVHGRLPFSEALKQPLGLLHGGVYAVLAEALTAGEGTRAISNATSFLRPVTRGAVHAAALRRHKGRTTEVWEVDCRDDAGRLCAIVRVTLRPSAAALAEPGVGERP